MKKIIALLLALAMLLSLAACGGSAEPEKKPTEGAASGEVTPEETKSLINFDEDPYEVSIQFVGLFEQNSNIANVEAALNAITVPAINVTVDIVPVFIGDLPTTTSLGVAGDEKMDIVTIGLTSPISNMVADDLLLPLDDLLAERGPAAMAVTANVAAAQKLDGVTYGVTGYPYSAGSGGFVYNKTLAEEYNIDMHDGMTLADFTEVGKILKEHGMYLTSFANSSQYNYQFWYGGQYFGSTSCYGGIHNPADSTTIVNVFDTPEIHEYYKAVKTWSDNGYLPADQLTDTTSIQEHFQAGNVFGTSTAYTASQLSSWASSNFEVGIVSLGDVTVSTTGVQEFMLGIAANCERPDKAMDLINLIYANADVANLLMYGVEGTDYVAVEGTQNVITREGTPNADGNSYSAPFPHFGDPMMQKVLTPLTDDVYADIMALEEKSRVTLTFGYAFDSSEYGAEAAAISNILAEKLPMLNAGMVEDVDAALAELNAALANAGINEAIAANQEQLDAYLAAN